jgi:serine/threonine-protein kinase
MGGHATTVGERWPTVSAGDRIVAVGGRPVDGPGEIRAAWNDIEPGALTFRLARDGREWEATAEAVPRSLGALAGTWLRVLTGAILLLAGAGVFALRPARPTTWAFLAFCFALAFHLLIYHAMLPWPPVGVALESVGMYASAGASVWLFSLFPSPLYRRRRWHAVYFVPAAVAAAVLAATYRRPEGFGTAVAVISAGYLVAMAAGLAAIGLIVAQLVRARRRGDRVDGAKCRALLVAVVLGLVFPTALGAFSELRSELDFVTSSLPVILFVVVAAYSIVRHNAFDVDRFTAAVVGYAGTTFVLLLAFGLVLIALPSLLGWSGVADSPLAGAAGAAVFFLVFSPIYRRVRRRVDRIFLRTSLAEEERLAVLRELAEVVRSADLAAALEAGEEAAATLHVTRSGIWTAGPDGAFDRFPGSGGEASVPVPAGSALVEALTGGGVRGHDELPRASEAQRELWNRGLALAVPITANDRLQGFVALGRKRNGTAYSGEERVFVETVASHLAIAFERSSGRTARLGPYRILERRGTGGMAEVFLAEKRGPGGFELRVALKRMLPHLGDDPDFVAMFLDEARIAAQLSHPNIVRILDIESLQGRYFIAMEYVDGPTLARLLRTAARSGDGGTLPLDVSAAIAGGMLRALQYAHTLEDHQGRPMRLVHRDVKPGNLMIGGQGEVKLGDFGIARAEFRLFSTEPGRAKGTVPYMAPELWRGQVTPAADLFAAGAVIYEMVTGAQAFPRGASHDRLLPATERDRRLPAALDAFLERALDLDPERRFASAAAMREAFLAAIAPVTPAPAEAVARTALTLCPSRIASPSDETSVLFAGGESDETSPTEPS